MQPHQRTPVKFATMGTMLAEAGYYAARTHYLVEGFRQGFRLRLDRTIPQVVYNRKSNARRVQGNNKTALSNPLAVEEKLKKELRAKRMIGPFLGPVFPDYVISPLGLGKKKVPGKFRVIHDLSAPFEGVSVNSCIPAEEGTVRYDMVDAAIHLIQ